MTASSRRLGSLETPESRARWLHEVGQLSAEEIGWRMGLPVARVWALLARGDAPAVVVPGGLLGARLLRGLGQRLRESYGLAGVVLAPMTREDEDPVAAIAAAGARHLVRLMQARGGPRLIGFSHGRSLAQMVQHLPELHAPGLRFVSLLGELTFAHSAYPHAVTARMSRRLGVQAYPFPAALYARSAEECTELLRQPVISNVMALGREAPLWVVGIGGLTRANQLYGVGMLDAGEDMSALIARSEGCEILGRFFDGAGQEVHSALVARTLAPARADFAGRRVLALAGRAEKIEPIRAALRGGLVQELITDHRTALALIAPAERPAFALIDR